MKQIETVFADPFENFCKSDLSSIKELKKKYEKTGAEFFHENSKYMAKKGKDEELFESAVEVANSRKAYHSATLDLVAKLNEIMMRKDVHLMESLIGLIKLQDDLHQKQHRLYTDLNGFIDKVNGMASTKRCELDRMVKETAERKQKILDKHSDMYNPLIIDKTLTLSDVSEKSGYLYKKSSHTMVRPIWSRRFFCLKKHTLEYYTLDEKADSETIPIDLKVCLIRAVENGERRFTFEILSPMKTYTLQAENEVDMHSWVDALQRAALRALQSDPQTDQSKDHIKRELGLTAADEKEEILAELLEENQLDFSALSEDTRAKLYAIEGNQICADCRSPRPEWASITFGILICIECSGIHRGLGVQKSKVKSLTLDYWEPDQLQVMMQMGNKRSWSIFEDSQDQSGPITYTQPTPSSDHASKEQWIVAKYDVFKFTSKTLFDDQFIIDAIKNKDMMSCMKWIVSNRTALSKNLELEYHPNALQLSISQGFWPFSCLLISWSVDSHVKDDRGWTSLHYLAANPSFSFGILLSIMRKLGTDLDTQITNDGMDPITLASESNNVKFIEVLNMLQYEQMPKPGTPDPTDDLIGETSGASPMMTPTRPTGVRHSLSKMFPHNIHRQLRSLVQQQYNYYHEKATRSRRSSVNIDSASNSAEFENTGFDELNESK